MLMKPDFVRDGREWYMIAKHRWLQETLLATFMFAIAEFEGFYKEGSIAQKNNNPGNLRPVGASTGFRSFETEEQGWDALRRQVELNVRRGLTLREFFLGKEGVYPGYAPLGDNDPEVMENYINHVEKRMGVVDYIDLRNFFPFLVPEFASPKFLYAYNPTNETFELP